MEGSHKIWNGIDSSTKEIIRSFLVHLHMELLKRSRFPAKNFRFELASVGNLFLTGARLFCGSLDSAIELLLRIARVPPGSAVVPCLNTNFTYHISAMLENGHVITGQSQISHPTPAESADYTSGDNPIMSPNMVSLQDELLFQEKKALDSENEFGTPSYTHPDLRKSQLHFCKTDNVPLPAPIDRIFYVSPYGEEIFPQAQSRVINSLESADCVVYSIGSLFTSIVPVLILQGVGRAIEKSASHKLKALLLNGSLDRETFSMDASGFVRSLMQAIDYSKKMESPEGLTKHLSDSIATYEDAGPDNRDFDVTTFLTHIFYLDPSLDVKVDIPSLEKLGLKCQPVKPQDKFPGRFDLLDLEMKLRSLLNK